MYCIKFFKAILDLVRFAVGVCMQIQDGIDITNISQTQIFFKAHVRMPCPYTYVSVQVLPSNVQEVSKALILA